LQNRNKCAPFGLHKSKVLLGTIWGTTWEHGKPFGNLMGAHMEYYGNEGNKQKKNLSPLHLPPPKWIFISSFCLGENMISTYS